jgi:hypothetical protein
MNNLLLLKAQQFLEGLEIRTQLTSTFLQVNRADVANLFEGKDDNERAASFLAELRSSVSNKFYLDKGSNEDYHLNCF